MPAQNHRTVAWSIFALALVTFVPAFTTWLPGLFMTVK